MHRRSTILRIIRLLAPRGGPPPLLRAPSLREPGVPAGRLAAGDALRGAHVRPPAVPIAAVDPRLRSCVAILRIACVPGALVRGQGRGGDAEVSGAFAV